MRARVSDGLFGSRLHIAVPPALGAILCALVLVATGARPETLDAPAREHGLAPLATPPADALPPLEDPARVGPPPIEWRESRAVGKPWDGRLIRGVRLPYEGRWWFTWDPILDTVPNRPWRRWGSDRLVRVLVRVLRDYSAAHPGAARAGVGDLSRPRGGEFGPRFGGLGHRSHQNGLDVDVYYPRRDGLEAGPRSPRQVDRRLAQDLVDRFVAAGASTVFVGPRTRLRGERGVVRELIHHDYHMHVRLRR